ncbi:flagellar protein FlaG [Desulfocapsa sulfexigens DSM 10523]|uniref:Flagellar protein FlaG n=1 Tax=Desulfocapsa sulfexigens (strain DSM 10523 / SB164P1) TaxID=1167006 RepID=M1P838_DESSD|nr:flagellar protein FlaG [Desulfocapsa sulfexigens]AGF79643.1 flagellar protein FlaG [Desulfocapsa sulfexigens DSM 10523]
MSSIEAMNATGSALQQMPRPADGVDSGRKDLKKGDVNLEKVSSPESGGVQPEELLNQIKSLTEDGLYSVRFENNQEFNKLVVKVVDTKTDEVIRQVPAEEILGMQANLEDLRGKLVDTVE